MSEERSGALCPRCNGTGLEPNCAVGSPRCFLCRGTGGEPTVQDAAGPLYALADKALRKRDGHLTLMRFTSHWKAMVGTPQLSERGMEEMSRLPGHESARTAMRWALANDPPSLPPDWEAREGLAGALDIVEDCQRLNEVICEECSELDDCVNLVELKLAKARRGSARRSADAVPDGGGSDLPANPPAGTAAAREWFGSISPEEQRIQYTNVLTSYRYAVEEIHRLQDELDAATMTTDEAREVLGERAALAEKKLDLTRRVVDLLTRAEAVRVVDIRRGQLDGRGLAGDFSADPSRLATVYLVLEVPRDSA